LRRMNVSKFKVGDIVRVIENWPYNLKIGEEFEVETTHNGRIRLKNFINNLVGNNSTLWPESSFELVSDSHKEESKVKQFDLKKDRWFISTPTPEASKLAQEWLFDQGIIWQSAVNDAKKVKFTDTSYLMSSLYEKGSFCWSTPKHIQGYEEITLTYKTIIDTITLPVLKEPESEAQKQLKVLKEQIAELSKQAEVLEGSL